jgi:hypothetical protein
VHFVSSYYIANHNARLENVKFEIGYRNGMWVITV